MHRHPEQQIGHPPLPPEGRKKRPFIEERDDPRRNSAPEIDAARGERLEGEIPRLRPKDGDEKPHGPGAEAVFFRQRRIDDDGRGIGRLRQTVGEPGRLLLRPPVPQKPVEPPEPRSRTDRFITDMIHLLPKLTEKIRLQRVGGSEIRMAPFRGMFPIASPVPGQKGLPKAGARGDHGNGAAGSRFAGTQRVEFRRFKERHGARSRRKIVQEADGLEAEGPPDCFRIREPGKVRDRRPTVDDRSGNGQTGPIRGKSVPFQEFPDQGLNPGEAVTLQDLLLERRPWAPPACKDRQATLRPADITGQQYHLFLTGCRQFTAEPVQVVAAAGSDGEGDDFRRFIGMEGADGLFDCPVAVLTTLDQAKPLPRRLDPPLPSIDAHYRSHDLDAAGESHLHKRPGDPLSILLFVGRRQHLDERVHRVTSPGPSPACIHTS